MKPIARVLWLVFGGALFALLCFMEGLVCFVTVLFWPIGIRAFQMGLFFLSPSGKAALPRDRNGFEIFIDVLFFILLGWETFLLLAAMGVLCCVSIVGISFGLQYFKAARLVVSPLAFALQREDKVAE